MKRRHSRKAQRGGAEHAAIIEVEFYKKNNQKLDTKDMRDRDVEAYSELEGTWNSILDVLLENGFKRVEPEEALKYEAELEQYPPESARVIAYEGDEEPELPDPIEELVEGIGTVTIKFVGLKKIDNEVDNDVEMNGGRKKRRSKTKKHNRNTKRRITRRR